jgi:hypothetical protein
MLSLFGSGIVLGLVFVGVVIIGLIARAFKGKGGD